MKMKLLLFCICVAVIQHSEAQRLSRDYVVTLLTNQVGYLPSSSKTCVLKTNANTAFEVIEITSGLAILFNRYTAFFLLILFPVSVNIFLFHTILAPAGIPMALVIIVLHVFLGIAYRKYYASIFTAVPVV